MTDTPKRQLLVEQLPGYQPEIARCIWMLQDARRRTHQFLEAIHPDVIDWSAPTTNSIGALLYHIAAIEIDWLYTEVLEGNMSQTIWDNFPYDVRDDAGRLTNVTGIKLEAHLQRLASTRDYLLEAFRGTSIDEFRRPRHLSEYTVTPEWVLHHLMQHEAEHRGEMATLRTLAEAALNIKT